MRNRPLIEGLSRPAGMLFCVMLISVKALREKIASLMDHVQAIMDVANKDERDLTDEEKREIDGIMGSGKKGEADFRAGQIHALEADLARAEAIENRQAELARQRSHAPPVPSGGLDDPPDSEPAPLARRVTIPTQCRYRHGALRAFTGPDAEREAYVAGTWFAATLFRHDRSRELCSGWGLDTRFHGALAGNDNSLGGFLVPTEVERAVVNLREEYGVFRRYARVVPMSSDTRDQPVRSSGLTAYFVGENAEITASDKEWTNAKLVAKKLGALCKYSSELSEDAIISIGDDLAAEIAYAFAVKEDACGFLGDGTSTYGGIVGLASALAAGSVYTGITGNTAFSTLDLADFESMLGKLPAYPGIQPAWFISKAGWAASMLRLADAAGGNTAAMLQDGSTKPMFLGYPVVWCQGLNSTLTAQTSTRLFYFGDLRMGALMGSRRGLSIMLSDQRYFEYDQIGIKGTERFDITIHGIGTSTAPGPIIGLTTDSS